MHTAASTFPTTVGTDVLTWLQTLSQSNQKTPSNERNRWGRRHEINVTSNTTLVTSKTTHGSILKKTTMKLLMRMRADICSVSQNTAPSYRYQRVVIATVQCKRKAPRHSLTGVRHVRQGVYQLHKQDLQVLCQGHARRMFGSSCAFHAVLAGCLHTCPQQFQGDRQADSHEALGHRCMHWRMCRTLVMHVRQRRHLLNGVPHVRECIQQ